MILFPSFSGPFSACITAYGTLSSTLHAACRYDVCGTGEVVCEIYEQLERHCNDNGVMVGQWRTTTLCRKF